ncbi:hypothetical protein GGF46_002811 [Coemansia sp. RSA 552]|nr:hypothetical protein GGF46_002811 [Coemansia sp. RSA 552]
MSADLSDPYADRQLVDEATQRSVLLCQMALRKPNTPTSTRVACLARLVMLLDALPSIRALDHRSRQIARAGNRRAKTLPDSDCSLQMSPRVAQLLFDRCTAYCDLAQANRRLGDVRAAAANYHRADSLIEALLSSALPASGHEQVRAAAVARQTQALGEWAEVEHAIGRPTSARRLEARAAGGRSDS